MNAATITSTKLNGPMRTIFFSTDDQRYYEVPVMVDAAASAALTANG